MRNLAEVGRAADRTGVLLEEPYREALNDFGVSMSLVRSNLSHDTSPRSLGLSKQSLATRKV